jgi:hypothetical protein
MAATQAFNISKVSQESLIQFHRTAPTLMEKQWNIRESMRLIDVAYIREADMTKEQAQLQLANIVGDANKIQNITVPIIKPQVRAAVAYQAAVFLTDYPLFGVVSAPQFISAAKQMQAVIEENSVRGSWVREFLLFFQDGFKYNLSAIEICWDKVTTAALETDPTAPGGKGANIRQIIWEGNKVRRWDPYNTYFDTRVDPYDIPEKGEYAGRTELMSRTALKAFIAKLDNKIIENIPAAFESPSVLNPLGAAQFGCSYYLPLINGKALLDPALLGMNDWDTWMGLATSPKNAGHIKYRGIYEVSTEYVRIIPSDHGMRVPAPNTPQVWKLIIINHSVIIYAERQTNAHEKIPVFFGCPSEDGLVYQTKSLAQDALPFQQVTSALMNSVLAGRRRAVTDRVLYDPSRIAEGHMNNPNPSAKIPVRPSAYGKPVGESVYQFPFRDDQAGIAMQEIQSLAQFANVLQGQNQARQGQFVKGNKTDGQWESTMSNATSQDQITALLYEAQVFTPLKEVLKLNMLQYQGPTSIYSPSNKQVVDVDPVALRQAIINFKITDGLLPADKVIKSDTMKVALQAIASSQTLAAGYNVAQLFSYLIRTENVDFTPFEKSPQQQAYEQAMGAWQQVAMLAAQKGMEIKTPMPKPEEFGYDPNMQNPEAQAQAQMSGSTGGMTNGNA